MSRQLNVQQQNANTVEEIRRAVAAFMSRCDALGWLADALLSRGLDPSQGLLVRFNVTPEQEGDLISGVWLTQSRAFWEFAAMVSRHTGALMQVECFENVTPSVMVSANQPGTGKSWGRLALEVLDGASPSGSRLAPGIRQAQPGRSVQCTGAESNRNN